MVTGGLTRLPPPRPRRRIAYRAPPTTRESKLRSVASTRTLSMASAGNPVTHCDHITRAWQYLLGEDFHYGYFKQADEPLEVATNNLAVLMAEKGLHWSRRLRARFRLWNRESCLLSRRAVRVPSHWYLDKPRRHRTCASSRGGKGCSDRVSFLLGDGMDNGMPDASFDRVWVLKASHPRKQGLALRMRACAPARRHVGSL
jgi:hypothetical protein